MNPTESHDTEMHEEHGSEALHGAQGDSPAAPASTGTRATVPSPLIATIKQWHAAMKSFFKECSRVLKITKKPTSQEFWTTVKVTGLGILIIGLIGFIISTIQLILKNLIIG